MSSSATPTTSRDASVACVAAVVEATWDRVRVEDPTQAGQRGLSDHPVAVDMLARIEQAGAGCAHPAPLRWGGIAALAARWLRVGLLGSAVAPAEEWTLVDATHGADIGPQFGGDLAFVFHHSPTGVVAACHGLHLRPCVQDMDSEVSRRMREERDPPSWHHIGLTGLRPWQVAESATFYTVEWLVAPRSEGLLDATVDMETDLWPRGLHTAKGLVSSPVVMGPQAQLLRDMVPPPEQGAAIPDRMSLLEVARFWPSWRVRETPWIPETECGC